MTPPDLTTDKYRDIVGRIIEARQAYERLNGAPPTVIHVNGLLLDALTDRGYRNGAEIAGMRIVSRIGAPADMAICSRDPALFKPKIAYADFAKAIEK